MYRHFVQSIAEECGVDEKDCQFILSNSIDSSKMKDHKQKDILVGGYIINVDELLAPIIQILNCNGLVTEMSCQYDLCGYSHIVFTFDGFRKWHSLLYDAAKRKYNDVDEIRSLPIINRFVWSPYDQMVSDVQNRCNHKDYHNTLALSVNDTGINVNWQFLHDDIDLITQQLKELFGSSEN